MKRLLKSIAYGYGAAAIALGLFVGICWADLNPPHHITEVILFRVLLHIFWITGTMATVFTYAMDPTKYDSPSN